MTTHPAARAIDPNPRSEAMRAEAAPDDPPVVDVDAVLDRVRFRGLPLIVLVCSTVILALDGFDIQIIGFVAPALMSEFSVARGDLAPVLAASLVGMAIGGLVVGPIGDSIGRRATLLISTALFACSTLAASFSMSLETLALWRFATGIGLGGALPCVTALMAEFSPPRWRSLAVSAAIVGVPVGGMIGAAIGAEIIPAFGWRAIFVIGGLLPLVWLAVVYLVLPESPRYLAARGVRPTELAALLNRIDGQRTYTGAERFVLGNESPVKREASVSVLLSRPLLRDTLAAWLIFGTNIFAVYALFNWAPLVLTSLGFDLATAVRALLLFNLAGVAGALTLSVLMPRFGSRVLLAGSAVGACAALGYLAWATATPAAASALPAFMAAVAVAGFTTIAIQVGMFPVVAHVYPVEARSTGIGWAIGLGRLGGIVSSFAGGWFMARIGGESGFFAGVAVTLAVTFLGVLMLRHHVPKIEQWR